MTVCIGIEIDVYMLEVNKLNNHMMVFERMIMMTVYSSPTCGYSIKYEIVSIELVKYVIDN